MFRQSTNQNHYPVWVMSLDGINGWLIQTLLRGENDSKQWDEFQATHTPPWKIWDFARLRDPGFNIQDRDFTSKYSEPETLSTENFEIML